MRSKFILFTVLFVSIVSTSMSFAVVPNELITGTLADDGTQWAVVTPKPIGAWNGTLILDLDGNAVRTNLNLTVQWLLEKGYAYGGTARSPVNYRFDKAVDHLVTVRKAFMDYYEKTPSRTIAMGNSRGAAVGRLCMEFYPAIFDGAFVSAGNGIGEIALMNSKLDSKWVLKTLINPASPAQLVGVPNTPAGMAAENAALGDLVATADSTDLGRARLALAAAVRQLPQWLIPSLPEPARNDYDAQYAQLIQDYPTNFFIASPFEEAAGGIMSWNDSVDYNVIVGRSGRQDFVQAMYEKAGLGRAALEADLRVLEKAPRVYADPEAVARAEKFMTYTGRIEGPLMFLHNIGDNGFSPSDKVAYDETARRAGNNKLIQTAFVHSARHANFADLEKITSFTVLVNYLDTGKWGDASADVLNALAQKLISETDVPLAVTARFIEYHPDRPVRTWDVSNWESYQ
jgi:hypothetical protein